MTARDSGGNVAIDFAWGNFPLQPDDDRGLAVLDPRLDSHDIAFTAWGGYPALDATPDVPDSIIVPSAIGLDGEFVQSILDSYGLAYATYLTEEGATEENDGTVESQYPLPGMTATWGDDLVLTLYHYVPAP